MENKPCLTCQAPVPQVDGRRSKLYCGPKCKQYYWHKIKPKEAKSKLLSAKDIALLKKVEKADVPAKPKVATKPAQNNPVDRLPDESSIDYRIRRSRLDLLLPAIKK